MLEENKIIKVSDDNQRLINSVPAYLDHINELILQYCEKWNIDPQNISQAQWRGALIYIYYNLYNPNKILLMDYLPFNNQMSIFYQWVYNIDKVNIALSIYSQICAIYNKIAFPTGFYNLTGISAKAINSWIVKNNIINNYNNNTANDNAIYNNSITNKDPEYIKRISAAPDYRTAMGSTQATRFFKENLRDVFRDSLDDKQASAALGVMALYNHAHGLDGAKEQQDDSAPEILSVEQLPRLSLDGGQTAGLLPEQTSSADI